MSKNYENTRKPEVQNETAKVAYPKHINNLVSQAAIVSSVHGYAPTGAEWVFTENELCKIVEDYAKSFLTDIETVTLHTNRKTGNISTFVWIQADSSHLVDNSTNQDDMAIRKKIVRFSKPLKEFIEKFCEKGTKLCDDAAGGRLKGIQVQLHKFIAMEIDIKGVNYEKLYGVKGPRVEFKIEPIFNKSNRSDEKFGSLNCVIAYKRVAGNRNTTKPVPKKAFKAI